MLSLAQAAARRGAAGQPLPPVFRLLEDREARICRSQLTLVIGPPGAGKSLLTGNLLVKMGVPSLALLLDQDQLTAAARFASIATGERFLDIKDHIDDYTDTLLGPVGHIQAAFRATEFDDIPLQVSAYEQRFGEPPTVLLLDNAGNLTSGLENEWGALKALTLELDEMARDLEIAVIACAHTTDLMGAEPAAREKLLGKVSQYPRLILSVGFNDVTGEYKIAVVKNSSGPTDKEAQRPILMWADPARMSVSEYRPNPQLVAAQRLPDIREAAPREYPELRQPARSFGGLHG